VQPENILLTADRVVKLAGAPSLCPVLVWAARGGSGVTGAMCGSSQTLACPSTCGRSGPSRARAPSTTWPPCAALPPRCMLTLASSMDLRMCRIHAVPLRIRDRGGGGPAQEVLCCPEKSHPQENKEKELLGYGSACDVWAVGVLAVELVTGHPPFERELHDPARLGFGFGPGWRATRRSLAQPHARPPHARRHGAVAGPECAPRRPDLQRVPALNRAHARAGAGRRIPVLRGAALGRAAGRQPRALARQLLPAGRPRQPLARGRLVRRRALRRRAAEPGRTRA